MQHHYHFYLRPKGLNVPHWYYFASVFAASAEEAAKWFKESVAEKQDALADIWAGTFKEFLANIWLGCFDVEWLDNEPFADPGRDMVVPRELTAVKFHDTQSLASPNGLDDSVFEDFPLRINRRRS